MSEMVLDPDPRSTYGASREYRAAWLAAFSDVVYPPPPPPVDPDVVVVFVPTDDPPVTPTEPGAAAYGGLIHVQSTPSASWTVTHNLGYKPDLLLFLSSDPDEPVYTDITYPNDNTAVVEWPSAETGVAYI